MSRYIIYHEETNSITGETNYFVWGDWYLKNTTRAYKRKPSMKALKEFANKYGFKDHDTARRAYDHCHDSYSKNGLNYEHTITLISFISL